MGKKSLLGKKNDPFGISKKKSILCMNESESHSCSGETGEVSFVFKVKTFSCQVLVCSVCMCVFACGSPGKRIRKKHSWSCLGHVCVLASLVNLVTCVCV